MKIKLFKINIKIKLFLLNYYFVLISFLKMPAVDNTNIAQFKIDYNDFLQGYILDVSHNNLSIQQVEEIIDFVIVNYQTYNIKHVDISYNNFEFQSNQGLRLLNKILFCYQLLHIGINASNGLAPVYNEQYKFTEAEKRLYQDNGIIIE